MKPLSRLLSLATAAAVITTTAQSAYLFSTLPVLPDYDYPAVYQMNENNVIVGTLSGAWGPMGARWKGNTLGAFPGLGPGYPHSAWAYGINNAGLVVGMLDVDGGPVKAKYNAPLIGSALLPTPAPAGVSTKLVAINDAGYAVGSYVSAAVTTAFYSHLLGTNAKLPLLKVGNNYVPIAINDDSDVLGSGSLKGVVYNLLDGTAVLVTSRVPTMVTAAALNNLGDVAGVMAGNTAYIMPKPAASPVITLGAGQVKTVHAMNDARELLVTTMTNRPAVLSTSGVFVYLDTAISSPWTIDKLADINNAGNVCGVVKRPATPADGVPYATIYRPFRLTEWVFVLPLLP